MIYYQNIKIDSKTLKFYKKLNLQVPATLNRLLKKSFFSQTRPWANKSKILSAGLPGADRSVFEKSIIINLNH